MKILATGGLMLAGAVGWIFWGPFLHWLWSFAPSSALWYPLYKLGCLILVGYFGGIGLPFLIIAASIAALVNA